MRIGHRLLVIGLCLASVSFGSLRARYSVPSLHTYGKPVIDTLPVDSASVFKGPITDTLVVIDTLTTPGTPDTATYYIGVLDSVNEAGSESGGSEKLRQEWRDAVEAGVWDDYDATNGFDAAAVTALGSTVVPTWVKDSMSIVDGKLWVDSLYEAGSAPYIWANSADPAAPLGGYFLMTFGHFKVPTTGNYTFITTGRYEGLRVWIDLNQDGILVDSSESNWHKTVSDSVFNADPSLKPTGTSTGAVKRVWESVSLEAGKTYRFASHYWHWGNQSSAVTFAWKKPGDTIAEVVPSSAFGARKQQGLPKATIVSMMVGDKALTGHDTTFICLDKTLAMKATVTGTESTDSIAYHWKVGDTTYITSSDSLNHTYRAGSKVQPQLHIVISNRSTFSRPSNSPFHVLYKGCTPKGSIAGLLVNNVALTESAVLQACSTNTTVTLIAKAENIIVPGDTLIYTWMLGDDSVIVVTKTDSTDTLKYDYTKLGTHTPKLKVKYDVWETGTITSAQTITVEECIVVGIRNMAPGEFIRFMGSAIYLNLQPKMSVKVSLFDVNGGRLFSERFTGNNRAFGIDFAKAGIPSGLYFAQVEQEGKAPLSARMMIP